MKKRAVRDWQRTLGTAAGMAALAFLLPALCFGGRAQAGGEEELPQVSQPAVLAPIPSAETETVDGGVTVRLLGTDGTVRELTLDDYLWGVVAAEMPAAFEQEALKAQAAAARTYTLWKMGRTTAHEEADVCADSACCQAWRSREEMAERWGEEAAEYEAKIAAAVAETDGLVLCWEGELIQAVYHSSSDGRTEDAAAVWGTEIPYLMGVDTPEGEEVPNHQTVVTMTAAEVSAALSGAGCDLSGDPKTWFQGFVYTENGSVASAQVGGVTLGGSALRSALGLRSARFAVEYDGGFTFTVTGYGHGVGMSQYGANALAAQGKMWQEITAWYYTGVTVEELSAVI